MDRAGWVTVSLGRVQCPGTGAEDCVEQRRARCFGAGGVSNEEVDEEFKSDFFDDNWSFRAGGDIAVMPIPALTIHLFADYQYRGYPVLVRVSPGFAVERRRTERSVALRCTERCRSERCRSERCRNVEGRCPERSAVLSEAEMPRDRALCVRSCARLP